MLKMRKSSFGRLLCSVVVCAGFAQASVLYDNSVSISSSDPTQLGRLSRNGVPTDWSGSVFPGVLNTTTAYHYLAISIQVPNWLSFLQISLDSNDANIFGSAYDTAYAPSSALPNRGLDVNYLGDAGGSGNSFGNPIFFQVISLSAENSPSGFGTVVVVLNQTTPAGGLNSPVGLLVEGFSDTNFNEVPAPVSLLLVGAGLVAVLGRRHCLRKAGFEEQPP